MGPASRPDKQQGSLLQNVYTTPLQHTDANVHREKCLNAYNRQIDIYLILYVWRTAYNLLDSSIKMHISNIIAEQRKRRYQPRYLYEI